MPKRSHLINETTMYSINPDNNTVVTHHFPWPSHSANLDTYKARGFSFEMPDIPVDKTEKQPETKPSIKTTGIVQDIPKGYYHCTRCDKNHMESIRTGLYKVSSTQNHPWVAISSARL